MIPIKQRDILRRRGQHATVEMYLEGQRQRQQRADRERRTNDIIDQERRSAAWMLKRIEDGRKAE